LDKGRQAKAKKDKERQKEIEGHKKNNKQALWFHFYETKVL
jgi:hypothetical protein